MKRERENTLGFRVLDFKCFDKSVFLQQSILLLEMLFRNDFIGLYPCAVEMGNSDRVGQNTNINHSFLNDQSTKSKKRLH